MLLLPFFIMSFGLCATERKVEPKRPDIDSKQIYKATRKMLNSKQNLRLLMVSSGIKVDKWKCLISKYIGKKDGRIYRRLETDVKKTRDKFDQIKTTMGISVRKSSKYYPYLKVSSLDELFPRLETKIQYIRHAEHMTCFVLQAASNDGGTIDKTENHRPGRRLPCALWGYNQTRECEMNFVKMCGAGTPVNLRECTGFEKGKSQSRN
uniref:Putative secreted protein 94 n=1 Tax=Amblyomma triste TaxID=251400 RepID=A0A023GE42_AMBTT